MKELTKTTHWIVITIMCIVACMTSSCKDDEPRTPKTIWLQSNNFVLSYDMLSDNSELCWDGGEMYVTDTIKEVVHRNGYNTLRLYFSRIKQVYNPDFSAYCCVYQIPENDKEYYKLSKKYGDEDWNCNLLLDSVNFYNHNFLGEDILNVDVVAIDNYNQAHKSGSSLNDIIKLGVVSPYKWISEGYPDLKMSSDGVIDWRNLSSQFNTETSLVEQGLFPIKMSSYSVLLLFQEAPEFSDVVRIEVSVTMENGKTYSVSGLIRW